MLKLLQLKVLLRLLLGCLIIIGVTGVIPVSYNTYLGLTQCPQISGIFICYIVSVGYITMLVAQIIPKNNIRLQNTIFYSSWGVVFLVALIGVIFEIVQGNACPKSTTGIPLCYLSLLLTLSILIVDSIKKQIK